MNDVSVVIFSDIASWFESDIPSGSLRRGPEGFFVAFFRLPIVSHYVVRVRKVAADGKNHERQSGKCREGSCDAVASGC